MFNKKLLIGLAILCGQTTNNQAISNLGQIALSGGFGTITGILTDKFASPENNVQHNMARSCALGAMILSALILYKNTPGAKLKKARAISEQVNQNRLMNIYANNSDDYIEAVLRLLVRDEYPLLTAFHELELIDDLVDQGIELLNQALNDAYGSFTKESDLLWEQSSFELLKQKVNDQLCFIKYSQEFAEQENKFISRASCSTNAFFLGKIESNLTNFIQKMAL